MRNDPANLGLAGRKTEPPQAAPTGPGRDAHAVAIVVYDGVTVFELGVACEVFGNELGGHVRRSLVPLLRVRHHPGAGDNRRRIPDAGRSRSWTESSVPTP